VFYSVQRVVLFPVLKFWSVVLCRWLKISEARSSKIAGGKNRVIVRGGLKIGLVF